MNNKTIYITLLLSFILLKLSFISYAQTFTEYEVKLGYLYQFTRFVTWPEDTNYENNEFVIGIYGINPFGNLPEQIFADKTFQGRKGRFITVNNVEEALLCQMIFINGKSKYEFLKFQKTLNNAPILLIGNNIENFCRIGGMINFTSKDDDFRFEISPSFTSKSKIKISSKLFAISRIIDAPVDEF